MVSRAIATGLTLLAAALAGCTSPPAGEGFGAYYAAQVTNSAGCTVHLPWPYANTTAYGPIHAGPTTTADLVTTEYGRALRLRGAENLAVNSTQTDTSPFPHQLTMQQTAWAPAEGGAEEATFWVGAQGCTGANLEMSWVHDQAPGLAYATSIRTVLTDGWVETAALRTKL